MARSHLPLALLYLALALLAASTSTASSVRMDRQLASPGRPWHRRGVSMSAVPGDVSEAAGEAAGEGAVPGAAMGAVPAPPAPPPPASAPAPTTTLPLAAPFGAGLRADLRRKLPLYLSDLRDGGRLQCAAATVFCFFACLAPALAFGNLMAALTGGAIGPVEFVLGTGIAGMVYALSAAQPLTIIGSTGPVLAFTAALYKASLGLGLPFLPLYAFTGLWTSAFLFIASTFSLSNVIGRLTRFTDETFSLLISLIFVQEAVKKAAGLFVDGSTGFAVASASTILTGATFLTANKLVKLRRSPFFTRGLRNAVSNFAPTIGVLAAWKLGDVFRGAAGVPLPGLPVPETLATTSGRPWLVPLMDLPTWAMWGAAVPAAMLTILLFMDQVISVRLINSPSNKLKKGVGNDLDMLATSVMTAFCSLFGFPWMIAATVRSLAHVRANTLYDDDGKVSGVIEQRVTAFGVHALIVAAILTFRPALATLPTAVMTGVFFYLGVSSLAGNQLWQRVKELFMQRGLEPDSPWKGTVPRGVVKSFTLLQVACLVGMIAVKESPAGVFFPVLIAALGPVRSLIARADRFRPYMDRLDGE